MRRAKVLIVDDAEENIDILVNTLEESYDIRVATNGERAISVAVIEKPDIILLDVMMPYMDGFEACKRLKDDPLTARIPIIFLTALSRHEEELKGLSLGAVDFIIKPFNPELVRLRVSNHVELKFYKDRLEDIVKDRTKELQLTQDVTIKSMGTLAEFRDPETGGHINRTQRYVRILLEELKKKDKYRDYLTVETIDLLTRSAPLHDIGKVGVHDDILLKPGKLTAQEFEEMKLHTIYGQSVIEKAEMELGKDSFLRFAKEIAHTHHEKWDGTGYPLGIKGEEIPLCGRVMAIADVYDALISRRVYKPPLPHEEAKSIIVGSRGSHLDPELVDVFLSVEEKFLEVALRHADNEEDVLSKMKRKKSIT